MSAISPAPRLVQLLLLLHRLQRLKTRKLFEQQRWKAIGNYQLTKMAKWALRCIESGPAPSPWTSAPAWFHCTGWNCSDYSIFPCDDGSWVRIDDILTLKILWTHDTKGITDDTYIYIYIYASMHACMHACMHGCLDRWMYVCV